MTEHEYDDLVDDLVRLGRTIPLAGPTPGLATAVLDRVRPVKPPARVPWRRRLVVAVAAALVALLAVPPVRATVADWFGFAGVIVERGPFGDEPAPPPPEVEPGTTLAEVAELVRFTVLVPTELGEPDAVDVSTDRTIVSMSWTTDDGVVRLDQFDGRLDFQMAKTSPGVAYAAVDGVDALWFDEPHEVVLLDAEGVRRTESARLAGHTLIWPNGATTLRLEGDLSLDRAVEIAASAVPLRVEEP